MNALYYEILHGNIYDTFGKYQLSYFSYLDPT